MALAFHAGLTGLRIIMLAALVICLVWTVMRVYKGRKTGLPLTLLSGSCVLLVCSHIILTFRDAGVRMLFWLVPAWAALVLVYYLYQRSFFCPPW